MAGLVLAAVQKVRSAAARSACSNNLRQGGIALHLYHDAHHAFPPGCSYRDGRDPHPHMGWATRLLPHLEREQLWRATLDAFARAPFFETVPPHVGLGTVIPLLTCPSDPRLAGPTDFGTFRAAHSSYLGVEGHDHQARGGILHLDSRVRLADVTDGASATLLVGERPPNAVMNYGWWYAGWGQAKNGSADMIRGVAEVNRSTDFGHCPRGPYRYGPGRFDDNCDMFHFWSPHPSGAHFLFADGSVKFLGYTAEAVMPALATRSGGEPAELP